MFLAVQILEMFLLFADIVTQSIFFWENKKSK